MKAVGFNQPRAIEDVHALEDIELDQPRPGPRDLLVAVEAVSVNPVDTKVRQRPLAEKDYKVLGYDAAGRVEAVGSEVRGFLPGDRVWYAGAMQRQGSNAQYQCVDERIVAKAPEGIGLQEAAALPLTTLTAWEALEDQLGLTPQNAKGKTLLIVGGAGGVGSIATQLAARHFGMTVIATAGRERSAEWCRAMGAHHTIDYRQGLVAPLKALGIEQVDQLLDHPRADLLRLLVLDDRALDANLVADEGMSGRGVARWHRDPSCSRCPPKAQAAPSNRRSTPASPAADGRAVDAGARRPRRSSRAATPGPPG